jgi:hypothetical protein
MVPVIDESEWPVVKATYGAKLTLPDIEEFEARLLAIFVKRGPMVVVADITVLSLATTTALHRKKVAEGADRLAQRGALLGEAIIIGNPVVRVLYHGYTWLKTREFPSKAFESPRDAHAWAKALAISLSLGSSARPESPDIPERPRR